MNLNDLYEKDIENQLKILTEELEQKEDILTVKNNQAKLDKIKDIVNSYKLDL